METRNKLMVTKGEVGGGTVRKVKGNRVSNSVITLHGDRWVLDLVW